MKKVIITAAVTAVVNCLLGHVLDVCVLGRNCPGNRG